MWLFPFKEKYCNSSLIIIFHSTVNSDWAVFTDEIVQFRQNGFSKWYFKQLNSPLLIDQGTGAITLMFKNKDSSAVQLFFILICAWDALWSTRSFKIKDKAFFSIISISSYAILDHNVACLKLQILQIMGFVSSLLRGKLDIELLSSVNVNGNCMPNSLRSPEQMYAYESALLGFLGLYPLKVSLVWIIASSSGYSKPSPSYCSWKLWDFISHK